MNNVLDVNDLEILPDDMFDNFDANTKCGEIIITKGQLNYLCIFCKNVYLSSQIFSEHLFEAHQIFTFEPIYNNNYDPTTKIQKYLGSNKNNEKQDEPDSQYDEKQIHLLNKTLKFTTIANSSPISTLNSNLDEDQFHSRSDIESNIFEDGNRDNLLLSSPVNFGDDNDDLIFNLEHHIINSNDPNYFYDSNDLDTGMNLIQDNPDKNFSLIENNIFNKNKSNNRDIKVQYEIFSQNTIEKTQSSIIVGEDHSNNSVKVSTTSIKKIKKSNLNDQIVITTKACMSTNKPFCCEICNKKFATIKNLKNHRNICAEKAPLSIPFGCTFCPRRFYNKDKCKRHEKIKHSSDLNPEIPKGYWKCKICYRLLRNTCSRKKHEDGHFLQSEKNGKKSQCSCGVCGKILSTSASLKVHMRIHNEENRFKCPFCPARFKFSTSLKTHELSHTGERQYQCRYCDKRFLQNSHRKNHEILHNKEKKLECPHCCMKFHRMDYLNSHMKNKHSVDKLKNLENNRPYQCKFCQSSFTAEKYLKNHERLHKNGIQYKCKYCDKSSIVKGIIERHEKTHLKTKEQYPCTFCTKQFESKNGLLSHIKTKHPNNNILEFKCGKCEQQFNNSSDLQEHIRKVCSIVVKSFGCDMCSARFELEHGLKVHKAVAHIIVDSSLH